MVPVAVGTQTAGSITRPASYCGVVGYVSSRAELPLRGVQALAPSFDSLGFLAREVADVCLLRRAVLAAEPVAPRPPRRVLLYPTGRSHVDPAMSRAVAPAAAALERVGTHLEVLEHQDDLAEASKLHAEVMAFEAYRSLSAERATGEELSEPLVDLLEQGARISFARYLAARLRLMTITGHIRLLLQDADAVLAPAALGEAPAREQGTGSPEMSRPWQALGLPTVTLPAAGPGDLPVGVQLVGGQLGDGGQPPQRGASRQPSVPSSRSRRRRPIDRSVWVW